MDPLPVLDELLPDVRDRLPALLADVGVSLADDWPGYATFLADNGAEVASTADRAARQLLAGCVDAAARALFEDGSRERLDETLVEWLRQMGDHRAMAEALHVHPQTVRYDSRACGRSSDRASTIPTSAPAC